MKVHWSAIGLNPKAPKSKKNLLETIMANSASKKKHKLHKPRSKLLKQSPAKCQKMSNTSVCECWTNVDSAEEFKHLLLWRNLLALQSRAVGFISPAPLSLLARSVSAFLGGTNLYNLSMCVTLNPVPRIPESTTLSIFGTATTQNTAPQPVQTLPVESACGDLSSKSSGNVKILQKVSQSARVCLVCVITSLGFYGILVG